MKFGYFAAALLPLAFASPILLDTPQEAGLTVEERNEGTDLLAAFDDIFAAIEERSDWFDDEFEDEEESEIEARSVSSVLAALKKVDSKIGAVNSALNKIGDNSKPSGSQALAVQKAGTELAGAVNSATKKTNASGKASNSGAKKIFSYVQGTLKPATINSLENFIKHKGAFKKGGYTNLVESRLKSLDGETKSLGKALLAKTSSKKLKKAGEKTLAAISKEFAKAINAY